MDVFLDALLKDTELREAHGVGKDRSKDVKEKSTRFEPTTESALLAKREKLDCAKCSG